MILCPTLFYRAWISLNQAVSHFASFKVAPVTLPGSRHDFLSELWTKSWNFFISILQLTAAALTSSSLPLLPQTSPHSALSLMKTHTYRCRGLSMLPNSESAGAQFPIPRMRSVV